MDLAPDPASPLHTGLEALNKTLNSICGQGVRHNHDIFPYYLGHAKKVFPHLDCLNELKLIRDKKMNFPCDRGVRHYHDIFPYYLGQA